jgi:pyruvate/2-oxoglutarate dehydrogenase complex dihydrolipoamide dehydrogenase (E3) component
LKDKIDIFNGTASFLSNHSIRIEGESQRTIDAKHVIIATGSRAWIPQVEGSQHGFFVNQVLLQMGSLIWRRNRERLPLQVLDTLLLNLQVEF